MTPSLLWPTTPASLVVEPPPFFPDLNLDRVVEKAVGGLEFDLRPLYYTPLHEPEAIRYRQAVFADLADPVLREALRAFVQAQQELRRLLKLAQTLSNPYQQQGYFLEAALLYVRSTRALGQALDGSCLASEGLKRVRAFLAQYRASAGFAALAQEAQGLQAALAAIRYTLHIQGDRVTVRAWAGEPDYQTELEAAFARFRQGHSKDYRVSFSDWNQLNHIEERILEGVVGLFPQVFAELAAFTLRHPGFPDPVLATLDWEVQFFLSYLDYLQPLQTAGLSFCLPEIAQDKWESLREGFELALARQQLEAGGKVVPNSFYLEDPERILVVTGPNQGGKTTFARMVGQVHHLARLGLPVPGTEARLFLCDQIFTHFERVEAAEALRGKLQDELLRVRQALLQATSESLFVFNEMFASTSLEDARFLSREVLESVRRLQALAVVVTFLDELASLGRDTVSLVAEVSPDDPTLRTFRILRRPADGKAYALAIASKYGLTYERLMARLARTAPTPLAGGGSP